MLAVGKAKGKAILRFVQQLKDATGLILKTKARTAAATNAIPTSA